MVTMTQNKLQHPIRANRLSATWWTLGKIARALAAVSAVYFLSRSTPWDIENKENAIILFTMLSALSIYAGRALERFCKKQVADYTPGYRAFFKWEEFRAVRHTKAPDYIAGFIINIIFVASFFLFNPYNATFSSIAYALGRILFIIGIVENARAVFYVTRNYPMMQKMDWWIFFTPATYLILLAPLLKSLSTLTGAEGNIALSYGLFFVGIFAYVLMWVFRFLKR